MNKMSFSLCYEEIIYIYMLIFLKKKKLGVIGMFTHPNRWGCNQMS